MAIIYPAIFIDSEKRQHQAEVILTPVTLSILYEVDGESMQVYWLAERIISTEQLEQGIILLYRHGDQRIENLVIHDKPLIDEIKVVYRRLPFANGGKRKGFSVRRKLFIFFSSVIGFILLMYFFLLPWLAEKVASNVSKEWEVSLGESIFESLSPTMTIDTGRTVLINDFYKQLSYESRYPIYITVVKQEVLNAYALPGGRIVVYDHLLEKLSSSTELAALLAHEVSHINQRHSLKNLARSLARKIFITFITGGQSGIGGVIIDNANNLKELHYSRALEIDADNKGVQLMEKSGVDAKGMESLIRLLQSNSSGNEPATLLSTHPEYEARIKNIRQKQRNVSNNSSDNGVIDKIFREIQTTGSIEKSW